MSTLEPIRADLFDAARNGTVDDIRRCLAAGDDVHAFHNGESVLQLAVRSGRPENVAAILEAGADPEVELGDTRLTVLCIACGQSPPAVVRALLDGGADPDRPDGRGYYPLARAMTWQPDTALEKTRAMLEAGADPTLTREGSTPPVWRAMRARSPELLALLLEAGVDVDSTDTTGETLLQHAVRHNKPELVEVLLVRRATVAHGATAVPLVVRAAARGHAQVVAALLDGGAEIDSRDGRGRDALRAAAIEGHDGLAADLLARGADPESVYEGLTLGEWAIKRSRTEILRSVIEHHGDEASLARWRDRAEAWDISDDAIWELLGGEPIPAPRTDAVPETCACDRWPRDVLTSELDDEPCLEELPRSAWRAETRWGHTLRRCRRTGLVIEAAGYDLYGKDRWEFRIAKESWSDFLEGLASGALRADAEFVASEARRLGEQASAPD